MGGPVLLELGQHRRHRQEDGAPQVRAVWLADGHADVEDDEVSLVRSEEHTSELQSRGHLVCRLLLEKKKKKKNILTQQELKHSNEEVTHVDTVRAAAALARP